MRSRQVVAEERDVTERGGHQQELGAGELQERDLPGPAAVRVTVEVELVHHHEPDVGVGALTQGDVGQHLGGAGDDRRARVDRGVAGQHADVRRAEHSAEGEELLADERLDRRGVVAVPSGCQSRVQGAGRDQRLTRTGGRRQDDVRPADQLDQRLLLRRVQGGAVVLGPSGEVGEQLVRVCGLRAQGGQVALVVEQGCWEGHREDQRASRTAARRQLNWMSSVARPKIFLPADFAVTMTTPVRVSGSSDLIRPPNSMSAPSADDTIAGADSRTV